MTQIARGSSARRLEHAMPEGRAFTVAQLVKRAGMSRGSVSRALLEVGAKKLPGHYPHRWYLGEEPSSLKLVVDGGVESVDPRVLVDRVNDVQALVKYPWQAVHGEAGAPPQTATVRELASALLSWADLMESRPDWVDVLSETA